MDDIFDKSTGLDGFDGFNDIDDSDFEEVQANNEPDTDEEDMFAGFDDLAAEIAKESSVETGIGVEVNGKRIPPADWVPNDPSNIGNELVEYVDEHVSELDESELFAIVEHIKLKYGIDYEELLQQKVAELSNSSGDELLSGDSEELGKPKDSDGLGDLEDLEGLEGLGNIGDSGDPDDEPGLELSDTLGADHDGSILDSDTLLTDNLDFVDPDRDFLSENGEIVIMDTNDTGDGFKIQYIDIENIAVVKRIRKENTNVEDLVQSIKSTGLLEPLVVMPTKTGGLYALIAGYRRLVACAKAGKRKIPCVINYNANTPEVPILEALYNHSKKYTIKEIVDYIDYLEKQKGIMSASMIEYLLQLNSGEYTKLKDILNDDDEEIVSKLFDGVYTIEMAFKKLEQRRKKESAEEKDNKKAAKVYEDEAESGADTIVGAGDEANADEALTDEEIKSLSFSVSELDDETDEESSLDEMVEDGKHMDGFEPNKQDYKDRERLDPTLRRAVLARDNNTCRCCLMSGQEYTEIFDVHHIVEVYLGGSDDIDNLVTLCTCCHKLVHLYARGELQIRSESELSDDEQVKFKKIVKLGKVIRKGMQMKGMKKDELKKVDKADTIGRTKPGTGQVAG